MSVSPFRIGQQVVIAHDLKGMGGTKGTVVDTGRRDDFTLRSSQAA